MQNKIYKTQKYQTREVNITVKTEKQVVLEVVQELMKIVIILQELVAG